jgi:signal peptidase II
MDDKQSAERPQPGDARRSSIRLSLLALGLLVAAGMVVLDQAVKLWLLFGLDLETRAPIRVTPFLDLVAVWNTGISYGLFPQNGPVGQLLLLGFKAAAVALLSVWLSRAGTRLTAVALGLIIGGAVGNAIDRLAFGAVFDFVLLHLSTANLNFRWYVFNLADVAIVAGVIGLLSDALVGKNAVKAP